jgi:hypothetical protein
MIDTNELRMLMQDFKLAGSPMFVQTAQMGELLDRLEAAEKRTTKLEERCAVLTDSLRLAVRQNDHDMLMTAEELRSCEVALEETK